MCSCWGVMLCRTHVEQCASPPSLPPPPHPHPPVQEGLEDYWRGKAGSGGPAAARAFRGHYCELWDRVVREAHAADLLFDQFLLDRLCSLLVALNTCVVEGGVWARGVVCVCGVGGGGSLVCCCCTGCHFPTCHPRC